LNETPTSTDSVVMQVIEYIEENYSKKITVADISSSLNYSESYIHKKIKEHLNMTVNEYLSRYRIKKSVQLLINEPERYIYEISSEVGIQDYKHFTAVFKKYTGVTAKEFKEKL
jgi:two-component system response regulator YesN